MMHRGEKVGLLFLGCFIKMFFFFFGHIFKVYNVLLW